MGLGRFVLAINNYLRGLQSASELYRLSDRHLLAKFSTNFLQIEGVTQLKSSISLTATKKMQVT
jgi:hypothetical protein